MKGLFLIFICVFLFSCTKNTVPKDILPPDTMEKIMWDQMRADAFIKDYLARDTTKNLSQENLLLQEKIFKKYKISRAVFYKSYDYYLEHDNMMKNLLDSIIAKEVRANEKAKDTRKLNKNEKVIPER